MIPLHSPFPSPFGRYERRRVQKIIGVGAPLGLGISRGSPPAMGIDKDRRTPATATSTDHPPRRVLRPQRATIAPTDERPPQNPEGDATHPPTDPCATLRRGVRTFAAPPADAKPSALTGEDAFCTMCVGGRVRSTPSGGAGASPPMEYCRGGCSRR